jgi:ribosome-binding factor A
MAESLALLGLAANIITFVDYASKIVAETRNIRDARQSSTDEIRELDLIVQHVQDHNANRLQENIDGVKLSRDEKHILAMVQECERLAAELKEIIGTLKVREGRLRTMESGRVVLRSMWKRKDIQSLQRRLESLDQRIRSSVSHALQK